MLWTSGDVSRIELRSRPTMLSAENPRGERGRGGTAGSGRKGSPAIWLEARATATIADIDGPGVVRHMWFTIPPMRPELMRSVLIHVFYEGASKPSISTPLLDFCGLALGRPAHHDSAFTVSPEGRGFINLMPMPFRRHLRIEIENGSDARLRLYYQLTCTREEVAAEAGYLHAQFRRESPTTLGRDYVILDGLRGPGRYLGTVVGIRVIDPGTWYGEGEVKIYLDGDDELPTICGTGLEDYVGTAWGMGSFHTQFSGVPIVVEVPGRPQNMPEFVSFYRWHVVDPIVFEHDCRVTIQQIGANRFLIGEEAQALRYEQTNPPATALGPRGGFAAVGLYERVDDYSSTAFVYCAEPQPVARADAGLASAGVQRAEHEKPDADETRLARLLGL